MNTVRGTPLPAPTITVVLKFTVLLPSGCSAWLILEAMTAHVQTAACVR